MEHRRFDLLRQTAILCAAPVAVLAGALSHASEPAAMPGETVIVEIDGDAVTAAEFREFFRSYLARKHRHGLKPEERADFANEAVAALETERLFLREADRRGIEADSAEVARRLGKLKARYADKPAMKSGFEQKRAQVEAGIADGVRIEALEAAVKDAGEISAGSITDYYESHPEIFTVPQSTDVSLILLGVPPYAPARDWDAAARQCED